MFTPYTIRGLTLPNRIVVSPMAMYSATDGMPDDFHLVHLGARAMGGAGLVFPEMTCVSPDARITPGCLGLWNEAQKEAFRRIVTFVHDKTPAKIGIQLGHAGRKGATKVAWEGTDQPLEEGGWPLVSASAIPYLPHSAVPRAATREDMDRITADFVRATKWADEAGFDMLELHCAHGYLLSSFLSPLTNRRDDEYGGSLENRMRFAIEVAEHVRAKWPAHKPLFMRLSAIDGAGWGLEHSVALARELARVGVDVIDCSGGGIFGGAGSGATPGYGYQVPYAERLRAEAGVRTMAVGVIVHARQAEAILREGRADLVAIAREALYNPNWPVDAARKLGVEDHFALMPPNYGWWLAKRESIPGFVPSTYGDSGEA